MARSRKDAPDVDGDAAVVAWHGRPVPDNGFRGTHAMTVDVEDYFHVEAFFNLIPRGDWDSFECRVERNVDRILQVFDDAGAVGTFFTLGWVAQRFPAMVRRIVAAGHELASHGLAHYRADGQTPAVFQQDVREAKTILEDVGSVAVQGYRAASFSISPRNLWAHEALSAVGYHYSSSIYPIRHDLYGVPRAPRYAFHPIAGSPFIEIPVSTVSRFGRNWPAGGGGYFRLLPYRVSLGNLRSIERAESRPCMFYFHPWEIDPRQPRVAGAGLKTRIRHYTNLARTERRLVALLRAFKWSRVDQVYPIARPA